MKPKKNCIKKKYEFLCIGLAIEKVKIYGFFFYIAKNIACSTVLWIFPFKKSTEYARNCRCLYSFKLEWNPLEIFIQNIAIRNLRFCYIWTNHLIFFICISLILLFGKIIYIFPSLNLCSLKKTKKSFGYISTKDYHWKLARLPLYMLHLPSHVLRSFEYTILIKKAMVNTIKMTVKSVFPIWGNFLDRYHPHNFYLMRIKSFLFFCTYFSFYKFLSRDILAWYHDNFQP